MPLGARLMPAKALALDAGVSTKTMCQVLRELEEQGVITITRAGTFRGDAFSHRQRQRDARRSIYSLSKRKWENALERLRSDILDGRFERHEPLPDVSRLSALYDISRPTLQKGLERLLSEGLVQKKGRQYFLPRPRALSSLASILFVTTVNLEDKSSIHSERGMQMISRMQWECKERGLRLEILGTGRHDDPGRLGARLKSLRTIHNFIGYLLFDMEQVGLNRVLRELIPFERPIAVFDDQGILELSPEFSQRSQIQVFRIASEEAGETVAKRLAEAGHRRIAYFSPFHMHAWSQKRLKSLLSVYNLEKDAVHEDAVRVFLHDNIPSIHFLAYALMDQKPAEFENIEKHISTYYRPHVMENYRKAVAAKLFNHVPEKVLSPLRNSAESVSEWLKAPIDNLTFTAIKDTLQERNGIASLGLFLQKDFKLAMADKSISAWVFCNDVTAIHAIKWLKTHSNKPIRNISILSFDNSLHAYEHSLTSYDFNFAGVGLRMLQYVLDPRLWATPGKAHVVQGFLVERASSRFNVR